MLRIEVIRALGASADVIERRVLTLADGATVADALSASGLDSPALAAYAVYGERVTAAHPLRDGDRVELLRPLQLDPKQARRQRAQVQRERGKPQ